MAWSIEGRYFEYCIHPATAAGLSDGDVTFSKAEIGSDLEAFGMRWRGKSGFSRHFSWAG